MSIVPRIRDIHMYVGSVSEWMESVGVSWEDKDAIYCDHCPERDNEGFPWTCPKYCPNRKGQLGWIELNAEEDFGIFIESIQSLATSQSPEVNRNAP